MNWLVERENILNEWVISITLFASVLPVPALFSVGKISYGNAGKMLLRPVPLVFALVAVFLVLIVDGAQIFAACLAAPYLQLVIFFLGGYAFRRMFGRDLVDIPIEQYSYDGKFGHAAFGYVIWILVFAVPFLMFVWASKVRA